MLDCALECEAPDGVVLNIWEHLRDCGAQVQFLRHSIFGTISRASTLPVFRGLLVAMLIGC